MDIRGRMVEPSKMDVERFQEIRRWWGLNKCDYAYQLGVGVEEIEKIEYGGTKMSEEVRLGIMCFLGVQDKAEVKALASHLNGLKKPKKPPARRVRKRKLGKVIPLEPRKVVPITNCLGETEPAHWTQSPHQLLPTKPGTPHHMSVVMRADGGLIF